CILLSTLLPCIVLWSLFDLYLFFSLVLVFSVFFFFFFNDTATTEIYTLSLHDALPICAIGCAACHTPLLMTGPSANPLFDRKPRSEEHTSELQSRFDLVCRLLLEKKKQKLTKCRRA